MELLDKPIEDQVVDQRLAELANRYDKAGSAVIQVLNMVGGQAEGLLDQLPAGLRANLQNGTERALHIAMSAADRSRGVIGEQPGWLTTAISTALGAAGGFGGLPSALAELPVTTTVLLHGIQGVAVENGFDPAEKSVLFDCVQVFAASGPLDRDDGADLAFFSTRMIVTGSAMQAMIARVAPRLAVVLGQKLAAQTVPLLGAVAGAATNYAYSSYYRDMAQVHFGLRRLAIEADRDHADLVTDLRARLAR
ncbi:MAG: EcsC family protein [Rhodobacter sp.]|nr:EcsC family protein [Rhodobacter sp.]